MNDGRFPDVIDLILKCVTVGGSEWHFNKKVL